MDDTELLNWFEEMANQGYCPSLVYDDAGHWAVSFEGVQRISDPSGDNIITVFVEKTQWQSSIREAILAAIAEV